MLCSAVRCGSRACGVVARRKPYGHGQTRAFAGHEWRGGAISAGRAVGGGNKPGCVRRLCSATTPKAPKQPKASAEGGASSPLPPKRPASKAEAAAAMAAATAGEGGGAAFSPPPVMTWKSVLAMGIAACGLVLYFNIEKDKRKAKQISQVTAVGKPSLGGPWTLVDMHGEPKTEQDYVGQRIMLYFGFAHCPDICPSELVKIGAIVDQLDSKFGPGTIKPLFISVDPERDSLKVLKHYSQDFHPSIDYLTGTKDQVAKAARAYRVYFTKADEHDEDEDYLVDHSIVMYLNGKGGEFEDFFTQRTTVTECVERITKFILADKDS